MKNKIGDLRDHLFETIEALKDDDDPMDVDRAGAIKKVADSIIDTAKVEIKFMELVGHRGTGFIPTDEKPQLGGPATPALGHAREGH